MTKPIIIIILLLLITLQFIPEQNTKRIEHDKVLTNIWEIRGDLQFYFPNKINGINEMEGWTLTQWAEEIGWKEYKLLKRYNEQTEKEYIYEKYLPIEKALNKIASQEYIIDKYDCKHFTTDLKNELENIGISSIAITGFSETNGHRWIAIEFEPITGNFINPNSYNNKYPEQQLTKNFLNTN